MHLLHYPLPSASLLNPSYCFLPLPCGTFHLWLLSFLFCLTVDYATGEPLFQISTKFSISSRQVLNLYKYIQRSLLVLDKIVQPRLLIAFFAVLASVYGALYWLISLI